ncbi:MAG TPA: ABC transporter permease subunit [Fimbriimonadaceae bacterium]|nr:ABC transporter permease subunit [Fimbriimonadaceae bacterium]
MGAAPASEVPPGGSPPPAAPALKPNVRHGSLRHAFTPNKVLSPSAMQIIVVMEIIAFLVLWSFSPWPILPHPAEVFGAFRGLWTKQGLGPALVSSFTFNVEALFYSTLISLAFGYLSVLPAMRPIVAAISKGRFLSLVGFSLLFLVVLGGGHTLKLALLVFGMTVFFLTSMASVIQEIPRSEFDYARTLHMSEWRVVWEVVILGTADKALEVMRQNAAMGWMMLTMVETIVRAEGGVGVLLMNNEKYMKLSEVFAIQLAVLLVGLFQDAGIGLIRRFLCPYAYLTIEQAK